MFSTLSISLKFTVSNYFFGVCLLVFRLSVNLQVFRKMTQSCPQLCLVSPNPKAYLNFSFEKTLLKAYTGCWRCNFLASWTVGRSEVLDFLWNNLNILLSLSRSLTLALRGTWKLPILESFCGFVLMSQLDFFRNIAFMYCILQTIQSRGCRSKENGREAEKEGESMQTCFTVLAPTWFKGNRSLSLTRLTFKYERVHFRTIYLKVGRERNVSTSPLLLLVQVPPRRGLNSLQLWVASDGH